jgi:hypothetical protein
LENIWSAGQGVNHIHAIESVEQIVARFHGEYRAAAMRPVFGRMKRADLIGGWEYHRWRIAYEDDRVTEPFGDGASGLLLYTG